MTTFPTGTVTLLFTDIEGSTQLVHRLGPRYRDVLAAYRCLLRSIFQAHDGHEVDTQGDSFFVAFPRAMDAVQAAVAIQRAVAAHPWPEGITMATRMGLHTGEPQRGSEGYVGIDVHRAARIGAAGHGGQVLLSEAIRGLVAHDMPHDVSLRDLGEHRLKDLRHLKRLFQLDIAGLPITFPPLKTLDARPNNLPLQLTSFVGRERDVEALHQRLRDPAIRLVTLTGPGGTGKTRLAVQAAADVLDSFSDGIWFVDLVPIREPDRVASTIAATLGVKEAAGQLLVETLKEYVRERQILLLLDNFEHVVAAASLLTDLRKAAPRLKVLVTSRSALHLSGEQEYPVAPLALPNLARREPADIVSQYPAVALFLQRAQAVKPDFLITDETASLAAELCVRLDGLPLAIELAAARVKVLPLPALLARLETRLKVLTGGARDLSTRQQTLRGAIEWSYNLLPPDQQILFARLGIFVDGCTLAATEAICLADGSLGLDSLDGLSALVDTSLLRQAEGVGDEPRFAMFETIREYATEQLAARGETEVLRERHAMHYLALAEEAEPQLDGPQQTLWLERLVEDDANLWAALVWSRSAPDRHQSEARLALALFPYWQARGNYTDAHLLTMMPEQLDDPLMRAKALIHAGNTAMFCGDPARARDLLEESLTLARLVDDRLLIAFAQLFLGRGAMIAGNYEEARTLLETSLDLFPQQDLSSRRAWAVQFLGEVFQNQGQLAQSMQYFREAHAMHQAIGNEVATAWGAFAVATVSCQMGDYAQAVASFEQVLAAFRKLKSTAGVATTLYWMGVIATMRGDLDEAACHFRESLRLFQRQPMRIHDALVLEGMAGLAGRVGRPTRAARLFGAAEALRVASGVALPPMVQQGYARNLDVARAQLDAQAWEAAWAEGRAMTLDQAIAYALEETTPAEPPA